VLIGLVANKMNDGNCFLLIYPNKNVSYIEYIIASLAKIFMMSVLDLY
jgi:hypothetical protein